MWRIDLGLDLSSPVGLAPDRLFFIAGPCVIESADHALALAGRLAEAARALAVPYIFKASFDKANRSSADAFRGPGLEAGLAVLDRVRRELGVPVLTDVHEAAQAERVAEIADVLQIPAFLCRQTDLIVAAARTGRVLNIKKGQFLAPWDMAHAVEKARKAGAAAVIVTERGASFGYNNLVADMRSLVELAALGCPVVFDATHSVQLPGGRGSSSGGDRRFIEPLARAAVATGVNGLFVEVHEDPDRALSDGPNALPLERFEPLLRRLLRIDAARRAELTPG